MTLDPKLTQRRWEGRHIQEHRAQRKRSHRRGSVHRRGEGPYPNNSGAATGGGLVFTGFTDGTFAAYDDTTMQQLWKINVGTGFNAPPMTFEVNGKQYVAILSGLSPISKRRHSHTPELREQRSPVKTT